MKKKNFAMLVLGVIGGMLFGIGLCMCLVPEWNAFKPGVVTTGIGMVLLLALLAVAMKGRKTAAKPVNWKLAGKITFGVLGTLVMGIGMCMILVWNKILWGILVGIVGIVMLLMLIPMCLGLK